MEKAKSLVKNRWQSREDFLSHFNLSYMEGEEKKYVEDLLWDYNHVFTGNCQILGKVWTFLLLGMFLQILYR